MVLNYILVGCPLRIGIQDSSSTDKDWNQEPEIRNPRREIQNEDCLGLPLHGAWQGGRVKVLLEAIPKTELPTKSKNVYLKPAQTIQGYRLYFLNPLNIDIKIEILIFCRYNFWIEVVGRIWWNIN